MLDAPDATDDSRPIDAPSVVLIGLRASGKSTIGRALSVRLGLPFVDLDHRTPRFAGSASVAEAIERLGLPAFRDAETRALRAALHDPACVLALGGGTPTAPNAGEMLREHQRAGQAIVVYLRASVATLRSRLATSDNLHRPSLTGQGLIEEVGTLFEQRDPLYRALADHIVEVDSSDTPTIVRFLAQKLA